MSSKSIYDPSGSAVILMEATYSCHFENDFLSMPAFPAFSSYGNRQFRILFLLSLFCCDYLKMNYHHIYWSITIGNKIEQV